MNTLIRTQVLLYEEQKRLVDALAASRSLSMGEIVRQALDNYLNVQTRNQSSRKIAIEKLAGSLVNSPSWKNVNAMQWQRKLRHEKGS